MKKVLSLIAGVSVFILGSCSAESVEPLMAASPLELNATAVSGTTIKIDNGKEPLLLIYRGEEQIYTPLSEISPEDISSIDIIKSPSAIKTYGEKAKDGVVIIRVK